MGLLGASAVLASSPATDNASNSVYGGGWTNGSSGGSGFSGGWTLSTSGSGSGGFYVGDSNNNGGTGGPGINSTGNKAWGIWANGGKTAEAVRPFSSKMTVGQTFTNYMDNGWINSGGPSVGFGLRNASGQNLFEFIFAGGDSSYKVRDGDGSTKLTGLGWTDKGLRIEFTLTTTTNYALKVTRLTDSSSYTRTNSLMSQTDQGIGQIRFWNYNAGSGSQYDALFNTIALACNDNPTTSASSDSPKCIGDTLHLSATGDSADTYNWSGPNSFSSTQQNPAITNVTTAAGGTYTVTRTSSGCVSAQATTVVTINPNPAAPTASNNGPVCEGQILNLSATGASGDYNWTGPTSFTSAAQNPAISNATAAASGTYNVWVTVDGCPSPQGSTAATVYANPTCSISGADSVCPQSSNTYTAPAGLTYSWSISGDGSIAGSTTAQSVNVTAGDPGSFVLSLTVTDSHGCTNSCQKSVSVTENPTTTATNNGPICAGAALELTAAGDAGDSYSWAGPDGFSSSQQNPSILNAAPAATGTYSVTRTVTGCNPFTTNTTATVNANPTCSISGADSVCPNSSGNSYSGPAAMSTYSWAITNATFNGSTTNQSVSVTAAGSGSFTLSLSITDSNGCSSSCQKTVTLAGPPSITAQPQDVTVCEGSSATLSVTANGSGLNYAWRKRDTGWGGMGAWTLNAGSGSLFVGSSTDNNAGTSASNSGTDINTSGRAWTMFAGASGVTEAVRAFNGSLAVGQTFKIDFDHGNNNGTVGFGLRNASGENRIEFYHRGTSGGGYKINVNGTEQNLDIPFTRAGLHIEITLTDTDSYSVVVGRYADHTAYGPFSGTLGGTTGSAITQARLFNAASGDCGYGCNDYTLYYNNISVGSKSDSAADPTYYDDGWQSGDGNGWAQFNTGSGAGGFFVGDSRNSGDGNDSNSDGDINSTGNKAWGIWANTGNLTRAVRPFGQALPVGGTFRIDMDNGYIATGSSVGFNLRNAANQDRFQLFFGGGNSNYSIIDASGTRDTGVAYTSEGLRTALTLTGTDHYSVTITRLVNGTSGTITGTLAGTSSSGIDRIRVFNNNAADNVAVNDRPKYDAFFNNIDFAVNDDNASAAAYADGWQATDDGGQSQLAGAADSTSLTIPTPNGSGAASYDVVVTDACARTVKSVAATPSVQGPPSGFIYPWEATICEGNTQSFDAFDFSGTEPFTLTWNGPNGFTSHQSYITVSAGGVYTLNITDGLGCMGTISATLTVNPVPQVTVTAPSYACSDSANNMASVTDAGEGASYGWSITSGTITDGQGTTAITWTAGPSGTATLTVGVTAGNGCGTSEIRQVSILPETTIEADETVCASSTGNLALIPDAGVGATYDWSITNGTITGGQGTSAILWTAGSDSPVMLGVVVTNAAGCTASGTWEVVVNPIPAAEITAPSAACGSSTNNTASVPDAGEGANYFWSMDNGSITSGDGTPYIAWTAGENGTNMLNVVVTGSNGCSVEGSSNVVINPLASTTITAPAYVCAGATNIATSVPDAGAGATYVWSLNNGTITGGSDAREITWTAGTAGQATLGVIVTTAAGCSNVGSNAVPVYPIPSGHITTSVCGSFANLATVPDAGPGATYAWDIVNGTITGGAGSRRISWVPTTNTTAELSVSVEGACGSDTGTKSVSVDCVTDSVGDGIPDAWRADYFGGDGTITNDSSCATCDADGDGVSNQDEYLRETDPTDPVLGPVGIVVNGGAAWATSRTIAIDPLEVPYPQILVSSVPAMVGAIPMSNPRQLFAYTLPDEGMDSRYEMWFQYADRNGTPVGPRMPAVVSVDTIAPWVEITSPTNSVSDQAFIHLQATVYDPLPEDPNTPEPSRPLKVWINGERYWNKRGTQIDIPRFAVQPNTNNAIIVTVEDQAGAQSEAGISVFVDPSTDTVAPQLSSVNLHPDASGVVLMPDVGELSLLGAVDDLNAMATVTVNDGEPMSMWFQGNQVRRTIPLDFGTNTIQIAARDAAGNASTNTVTVVRTDRLQVRLLEPAAGSFVNGPFWARVAPAPLDGAGVQSVSVNGVAANQIYDGSYAAYITNVSGATQAMSVDVTVNYNNGTSQTVPLAVIEGYELIGEMVVEEGVNVSFAGGPPWCKHFTWGAASKYNTFYEYHAPATLSDLNSYTLYQGWATQGTYCAPEPKPELVSFPVYYSATNQVHTVGQAGRGMGFGDWKWGGDHTHCIYSDYTKSVGENFRYQMTANLFPYEPGTTVIVTFVGLWYRVPSLPPWDPPDLAKVKFQGQSPVAASGNTASYLVTVPDDRLLVIEPGAFDYPAPEPNPWPEYHPEQSCGVLDTWVIQAKQLGFSGWHNEKAPECFGLCEPNVKMVDLGPITGPEEIKFKGKCFGTSVTGPKLVWEDYDGCKNHLELWCEEGGSVGGRHYRLKYNGQEIAYCPFDGGENAGRFFKSKGGCRYVSIEWYSHDPCFSLPPYRARYFQYDPITPKSWPPQSFSFNHCPKVWETPGGVPQ